MVLLTKRWFYEWSWEKKPNNSFCLHWVCVLIQCSWILKYESIGNIMDGRKRASEPATESPKKTKEKKIIWRNKSLPTGNDGYLLFRFGRPNSARSGRWQVFFFYFLSTTLKHNHFGSFQSTNHCSVKSLFFSLIHLNFKVNIAQIAYRPSQTKPEFLEWDFTLCCFYFIEHWTLSFIWFYRFLSVGLCLYYPMRWWSNFDETY